MIANDVSMLALSMIVPLALGLVVPVGRSSAVKRALSQTFLGGAMVATAMWLVLNWFGAFTGGSRYTIDGAFINAFGGAALPEESMKLLVLSAVLVWSKRRGAPVSVFHGVLAGLTLGLGFATVENVVYSLQGDGSNGLIRLMSAVPCHTFLGAVMGHYMAGFILTRQPLLALKAWLVPLIAHGLYNLPLLLEPTAYPRTGGVEDIVLSSLVLVWLAAWTRLLVSRLGPAASVSVVSFRAPE